MTNDLILDVQKETKPDIHFSQNHINNEVQDDRFILEIRKAFLIRQYTIQ